jgi:hypothetical protein
MRTLRERENATGACANQCPPVILFCEKYNHGPADLRRSSRGLSRPMTKAVLTTKVDPTYDDLPEVRDHFPRTHLRQVEAALGDWIVYYEPRRTTGDLSSRGGRQAYIATARVDRIDPDPARPDHFYAFVSAKKYVRHDGAADLQRQRPRRGPGRPHPPRGGQWPRFRSQRARALLDHSLDVRPRPRLDR